MAPSFQMIPFNRLPVLLDSGVGGGGVGKSSLTLCAPQNFQNSFLSIKSLLNGIYLAGNGLLRHEFVLSVELCIVGVLNGVFKFLEWDCVGLLAFLGFWRVRSVALMGDGAAF